MDGKLQSHLEWPYPPFWIKLELGSLDISWTRSAVALARAICMQERRPHLTYYSTSFMFVYLFPWQSVVEITTMGKESL